MNNRWRASIVAVAAIALLAVPPASGQSDDVRRRRSEIERELQSLRSQYDETVAAEAELLGEYQVSSQLEAELDAQVTVLDGQIAVVQGELATAQAELDRLSTYLASVEQRLAEIRAQLALAEEALEAQAVAAYVGQDTGDALTEWLLGSGDLSDVSAGAGYIAIIVRRQQDVIDRQSDLEEDTDLLRSEVDGARQAATAQRDVVAGHEAELAAARQAQAALQAAAADELARQSALLEQVGAKKSDYESRIAALTRESTSLAELLRRRQSGQGRYAGTLGFPVPGYSIGSGFGYRVHPIFGTRRLHAGVDIGAPSGTPIRAAAAGVVVSAGPRGGYGNAVVLDHGGSLATLYAHQSRLAVGAGERVAKGEVIGYVGSTGFSTGPHLHFETRVSGTPVSPLNYL